MRVCVRSACRHRDPIIEIEHDARIVDLPSVLLDLDRELALIPIPILHANEAKTERAEIVTSGERLLIEDLRKRVDRIASEGRVRVCAAVPAEDAERVLKTVIGERSREADDMPAVDEPPLEARLIGLELIEMDLRRVLIKARREHMVRLFDRHAVDMIDALADLIVVEEIASAAWPRRAI